MVMKRQRVLALYTTRQTSTIFSPVGTSPKNMRMSAIKAMRMLVHNSDSLCHEFGTAITTKPIKENGRTCS